MADPLRHDCKLDVAEEILDFIANSPDAEEVRTKIRDLLELTDNDLYLAHDVVNDFRNLIKDQEF